jgi:hypothetical protein
MSLSTSHPAPLTQVQVVDDDSRVLGKREVPVIKWDQYYPGGVMQQLIDVFGLTPSPTGTSDQNSVGPTGPGGS